MGKQPGSGFQAFACEEGLCARVEYGGPVGAQYKVRGLGQGEMWWWCWQVIQSWLPTERLIKGANTLKDMGAVLLIVR